MQIEPIIDKIQSSARKRTSHYAILNGNNSIALTILDMKMWLIMLIEIHVYYDSIRTADLRHIFPPNLNTLRHQMSFRKDKLFLLIANFVKECIYKHPSAGLRRDVSWSHQGLNLGPPDYESGATNQLSYRTKIYKWFGVVTEPHCKYNTFFRYLRLVELDFNLNT